MTSCKRARTNTIPNPTPVFVDYIVGLEGRSIQKSVRESPNFERLPPNSTSRGGETGFLHLTPTDHDHPLDKCLVAAADWTPCPSDSSIRARMFWKVWDLTLWSLARRVCKMWREHFLLDVPILSNGSASMLDTFYMDHCMPNVFWSANKARVREIYLTGSDNLKTIQPHLCRDLQHFSVHVKDTWTLHDVEAHWLPFLSRTIPRFTLTLVNCSRHSATYYPWDLLTFRDYVTHAIIEQSYLNLSPICIKEGKKVYPRLEQLDLEGVTIYDFALFLEAMPRLSTLRLVNVFIQHNTREGLEILGQRAATLDVSFKVPPSGKYKRVEATEYTDPAVLRQRALDLEEAMQALANPHFSWNGANFCPEKFSLQ